MHRNHEFRISRFILGVGWFMFQSFSLLGQQAALNVSKEARLSGEYGLRVVLDGTGPFYLDDTGIQNEESLQMRVYIRIEKLQLQTGSSLVVFSGKNQGGEPVISLIVRKNATDYSLHWQTLLDSGTILDSTENPVLSAGWHAIEMEWKTGDGSGLVRIWVDDIESSQTLDLTNGTIRASSAQLGCIEQPPTGASGSFDLDAYQLRRRGKIGLICYSREQWLGALNHWPSGQTIRTLLERMENRCL